MRLHEITAHRIEQFKRERLAGRWRGHKTTGPAKPIQPATVNRELDGLRAILNKAVEWGKLLESPARNVKRLKVDNRRTRILTGDEQRAILAACPPKASSHRLAGAHHGGQDWRVAGFALGRTARAGSYCFGRQRTARPDAFRSPQRSRLYWMLSRVHTRGCSPTARRSNRISLCGRYLTEPLRALASPRAMSPYTLADTRR